jgi:hypothetical protein
MKKIAAISVLLLLLSACGSPPPAPKPQAVGKDGSWKVFVANPGKSDMLCYAATSPEETEGSIGARESRPFLMATRRTSGKIEISTSAGYDYMPGSKVELAVDDDTHNLYYQKDVAWARGDQEDRDIIDSMEDADDIEVRGLSTAKLTSVDYYPSDGFGAAVDHIRQLCP